MIRRAGKLTESLEFLSPTDTPDGKGGIDRVWPVVDKRRAAKEHKGTRTFHALQQRYTQATDVFRLREFHVEASWKVKHDRDTYRIIGIELHDRETLLVCEVETQGAKTYGH